MIDQFKPSIYKINYKSLILLCSLLFVQLFSLLIFPNNNFVSIIIGILSVLVALFPIAQVILLKKYQFLLSSYVLFSAAPAWFLYLEGISSDGDGFNYLTPNTRIFVYMLSTIFFIFLNLFYYYILRGKVLIPPSPRFPILPRKYIFIITIIFFVMPIIIIGNIQHGGSVDATFDALTKGRVGGEGMGVLLRVDWRGNANSLLLPLMWLFKLVPLFFSMGLFSNTRKPYLNLKQPLAIVAGLCAVSVSIFYFLGGSRGEFILVVGPPIIMFFFNEILISNSLFKIARFFIVAFIVVSSLFQLQFAFRGNMLDKISLDNATAIIADSSYGTNVHKDNNFYLTGVAFEQVPRNYPFIGFTPIIIDLVNPIPRAIWPNKPNHRDSDKGFDALNSGPLLMGTPSLSLSVVGDFYLMGGFFGLILGSFIFAFILSYFDHIYYNLLYSYQIGQACIALSGMLAFWAFRNFGTFITLGYPLFAIIIFGIIYKSFFRTQAKYN